ncbi:MAG: hypothetical protein GF330_00045 [Candidatus Eisenbacteria bacterium]|nr:hypothetical protein [Candidatus Eisenbacteria bacterium]
MWTMLYALLAISASLEFAVGVWFAIAGSSHPFLQWLMQSVVGRTDLPEPFRFLAYFIALACLLAAGLHLLAWRMIRDEEEAGHTLVTLYGAFALLGGALLFLGARGIGALSSAGSAPMPAWVFLVADSLRGALLVSVAAIARSSPRTLSSLRLPSERVRRSREDRRRGGDRDRSDRLRTRSDSRRRGGGSRRSRSDRRRGGGQREDERKRAVDRPREERRRRKPAAAQSGSGGTTAATGEERPRSSRRRRRGSRGSRRRGGRGRPSPSAESASSSSASPATEQTEPTQKRETEPTRKRQSEREARGSQKRRGRDVRSRSREREPGREGSGREDRRRSRPQPETSKAAEDRPSAAELVDRLPEATWKDVGVGGRRKKGRYSTGALFRPRPTRVRRQLGGGFAATEEDWSWPALEEPAAEPEPPEAEETTRNKRREAAASRPAAADDALREETREANGGQAPSNGETSEQAPSDDEPRPPA